MCWIGYAPRDRSQLPKDHLENAHEHNDDAWGFMYPKDGRVVIVRDITKHEEFRKHWLEVPLQTAVAAHFRFGTSGSMGPEMAHPFPVLFDDDGNVTLAMMHNGVLSVVDADKKTQESDTAVLIRDVITPQLEMYPELIESEAWRWTIGELIGNPNKLVFMRGDGEVFIINDYQGKYHDGGVWYSNEYSIQPTYTKYRAGKTSAYGGGNQYKGALGEYYYGGSGAYAGRHENWDNEVGSASSATCGWKGSDDKKAADKSSEATPPKTTYQEFLDGLKKDGWVFRDNRYVKMKDGKVVEGSLPPDKQPTIIMKGGESFISVGGELFPYIGEKGIQVVNEPLDTLDERPKLMALLDESDVAEIEHRSSAKVVDVEEELDVNTVKELTDHIYDMSEAEIYNWVCNSSPEDITDALMELSGQGYYQ